MSDPFESPSKAASQAASQEQGISQQAVNQAEGYVSGQEQQLRGAISGLGPNPYFGAAASMSPAGYQVNPNDTQTFGQSNLPPGLEQGTPASTSSQPTGAQGNPFSPPSGPPQAPPNGAPVQQPPITTQPVMRGGGANTQGGATPNPFAGRAMAQ
jgi:hypothetical protein